MRPRVMGQRRLGRAAVLCLMAVAWFAVGFLAGRGGFWRPAAVDELAWDYPRAEVPPETTSEHRAQLEQVIEIVHQIVDIHGSDANAIAALAVLHYLCYDTQAEVVCWERCLELDPTFPQAYARLVALAEQQGAYERIIELMERVRPYPEALDQAQRQQQLASALVQLRRFDEARDILETLVEREQGGANVYLLLGDIYSRQDQLLKARDALETALALDASLIDALYRLFMVCSKLGEQDRAARYRARFDAMRSAELRSESARGARHQMQDDAFVTTRLGEALRYAGAACIAKDDVQGAEVCLLQAALIDAQNAEARRLLAELYLRTDQQLSRAERLIAEAAEVDPTPRTLLVQAALAERVGDVGRARQILEAVLELAPDQQDYRVLYESLSKSQ